MKERLKLYLAGPMRGYEEFNFPAFETATQALRKEGYTVLTPHENDGERLWREAVEKGEIDIGKSTTKFFMGIDLPMVLESDMVVVLEGWEKSEGAQIETWVAFMCDIPVCPYEGDGKIGKSLPKNVHPHFQETQTNTPNKILDYLIANAHHIASYHKALYLIIYGINYEEVIVELLETQQKELKAYKELLGLRVV